MSNFTTLIPVQLRYVHHFRIFTYLIAASLKRLQSVCTKVHIIRSVFWTFLTKYTLHFPFILLGPRPHVRISWLPRKFPEVLLVEMLLSTPPGKLSMVANFALLSSVVVQQVHVPRKL